MSSSLRRSLLTGFLLPLLLLTTITQRDGLPSNGVTALAWDGGTLWVGTVYGLGQWGDGRAATEELPLDARHVLALHTEGDALWVGTWDGVARRTGEAWQTWQRGDDGLRSDWATSFAMHEGALVVGTYGGGTHRWTGAQWEPLGGPPQVTALTSSGDTLWVGTPRGLWARRGGTWQRASLPGDARDVRALLTTGSSIWAGGDEGLFRARAGGDWSAMPVTERVTALAAVPGGVVAATPTRLVTLAGDTIDATPVPSPVSALLTAGEWLWIGTLGHGVLASGAPLPHATDEPLPVVLLHGLGDSDRLAASNLRFVAQWLRRDGHAVALVPYDERAPLLRNVAAVRATAAALREQTGQSRVVLVAHSLGGLLARAYLASGAEDVAGLATLGTPHAGTRLAYDFLVTDLATDAAPSTRELLPEHAALVAPFWQRPDVPQLHIGGDLLPQRNLFAGFPPHDGIVTAASATAAEGATRHRALLHGWTLPTLQFGIPSLLWPDDLYVNTLRPWLQSLDRVPWTTRDPALPLPEPGFTQRALWDGSLAPGETVVASVSLDGSPATWFLEGPGVTLDLIAPDGTRFRGERYALGDTVAHLPYRDNTLEPLDLWSTRQRPGLWQGRLTNEGPTPVEARLAVVEPERVSLELSLARPWVAPGDAVTVDVTGAAGHSLVVALGDTEVPLVEGSPGRYRASLAAPDAPGYHALRVTDGEVERWAVVGVRRAGWRVDTAHAVVAGDEVALDLTIEGAGEVALGLRLRDGEEVLAARLVGPFPLPAGATRPLRVTLPLSDARGDLWLDWQLFDAGGALVPASDLRTVPVAQSPAVLHRSFADPPSLVTPP